MRQDEIRLIINQFLQYLIDNDISLTPKEVEQSLSAQEIWRLRQEFLSQLGAEDA